MSETTSASTHVRATIEDLRAIVAEIEAFWGERDMAGLHQSLYVHEDGDTALVIRDGGGGVLAYLLGFVTLDHVGYIHVVGVRSGHRRQGLARRLYEDFESLARERRAVALKAITSPANHGSIAFHRALGFSVTEVPGYSVSGEPRVVLQRELSTSRASL